MFDLSDKLKGLRDEAGLTQTEVADFLNITKPTYASYEKGKDISVGTLYKLADLYRIDFSEFFELLDDDDSVKIPIVSSKASAGLGNFADDDILRWIKLSKLVAKTATFATYIDGDSMEPKIHDDDLVLVQQTPILDSGEIGIFVLNEEVFCKKFQYNEVTKEILLKSLNLDYKPIKIREDDDFRIIGRVVGVIDYTI